MLIEVSTFLDAGSNRTWQLEFERIIKYGTDSKVGIIYYRDFCWIPALRFAAAGMTSPLFISGCLCLKGEGTLILTTETYFL